MMKIMKLSTSTLIAIFFASILFTSCGDDETKPEEGSEFVGSYTIKSAIVTESPDLEIVLNDSQDTMSVPFVGQDFTAMIQQAILGVIPDCSADASLIELREDMSMYFSCSSSDFELPAGTWSVEESDGTTTIIMNFNSAAIPSSPTGFTFNVYNVELKDGVMYSTAGIPIPRELIAAGMAADGTATLTENNPDIINFVMDLEFAKVK